MARLTPAFILTVLLALPVPSLALTEAERQEAISMLAQLGYVPTDVDVDDETVTAAVNAYQRD